MEEIRLEMMNCFGRGGDKLETIIEYGIICDSIERFIELLNYFQSIIIVPSNEKQKFFGRLKNIYFTRKEREHLLKKYNSLKLKEYIAEEKLRKLFEENEGLQEWMLAKEIEKLEASIDEEKGDEIEDEIPISLKNIIENLGNVIDGNTSIIQQAKYYVIDINTYKLSFTDMELNYFIEVLRKLKGKITVFPKYDFENESNNDCIGTSIMIRIPKDSLKDSNNKIKG